MSSALSRPSRGRSSSLRLAALSAATGLVVALSGCSGASSDAAVSSPRPAAGGSTSASAPSSASARASASASPSASGVTPTAAAPVTVATKPEAGSWEVNPATPVTVTAAHGTLAEVSLTAADGTVVTGTTSGAGATWTSSGRLAFNTDYTLAYTTRDAAGATRTASAQFTTVATQNEADAVVYPSAQMTTVGVGQPIQFRFSEPVVNRDAVEKAISISSSAGQQGDFHWYSDQLVRFRAEHYWKANSTLTIDAKLFGVDFGNGQIGNRDYRQTIRIGDEKIAVADDTTKRMTITVNGKQVGGYAITLGDEEWRSTFGTKVIMDQHATTTFNAGTIGLKPGDPKYYPPTTVHNASRLSNGGEFIHQALPSAQPLLGLVNVSHGCIGMSPTGAKWVYENMTAGDLVIVKNTGYGPMDPTDGFGDWTVPWSAWAN